MRCRTHRTIFSTQFRFGFGDLQPPTVFGGGGDGNSGGGCGGEHKEGDGVSQLLQESYMTSIMTV